MEIKIIKRKDSTQTITSESGRLTFTKTATPSEFSFDSSDKVKDVEGIEFFLKAAYNCGRANEPFFCETTVEG